MVTAISFLALLVSAAPASIVTDVRLALKRNDLRGAEQLVAAYRTKNGTTPDALLALSWLARGARQAGDLNKAEQYAVETRKLVLADLKTRKLEADKVLPLALGAAIEVHSEVLAQRGERSEAVRFLSAELKSWRGTSVEARIQKNLNLLTLEGKPAPALDTAHWIGVQPKPLAAYRGHPVLLFFWAHWCPDCKQETPTIVRIRDTFGPRGLVILAPTQHYGYVARGEEAPPEEETRYIEQVWRSAYAPISSLPAPLSEENFKTYGASTVPTEVLIGRNGIVRLYHPDVISYEELATAIQKALAE